MSHKIDDQFDYYGVTYSTNSNDIIPQYKYYQELNNETEPLIMVQRKPNGTAQQYQYKLHEDFGIYGVQPRFTNLTPKKPGQWIDFVYKNTEDLYLYIEINFSKYGSGDGINTEYSVSSANLIVNQTLPNQNFSGNYQIATDKDGGKFYKILMGRRLLAILPYGKNPISTLTNQQGITLVTQGEAQNGIYKPFLRNL
jgi:hypothetical protein